MASGDVHLMPMTGVDIGTSLTTVKTVTNGRTAIKVTLIVCNSSNATRTFDIHLRASADAQNLTKDLFRAANSSGANGIEAGKSEVISLPGINLPAQAVIEAKADATGVNILCSLVERED